MSRSLVLLWAAIIFAGCASTSDPIRMSHTGHIRPGATSRLSVGMPKQDVINLFGPPESVSADDKQETLTYVEERPWWQWVKINVVIVDGKVASFGETRD